MKLHRISKDSLFFNQGFTLVELVVVLGIITVLLFITPVFDITNFAHGNVFDEAGFFSNILVRARNMSMNTDTVYGVRIKEETYLLIFLNDFQDEIIKEIFPRDKNVKIFGPEFVLFEKGGGVGEQAEIIFVNGNASTSVFINYEGGIE